MRFDKSVWAAKAQAKNFKKGVRYAEYHDYPLRDLMRLGIKPILHKRSKLFSKIKRSYAKNKPEDLQGVLFALDGASYKDLWNCWQRMRIRRIA